MHTEKKGTGEYNAGASQEERCRIVRDRARTREMHCSFYLLPVMTLCVANDLWAAPFADGSVL